MTDSFLCSNYLYKGFTLTSLYCKVSCARAEILTKNPRCLNKESPRALPEEPTWGMLVKFWLVWLSLGYTAVQRIQCRNQHLLQSNLNTLHLSKAMLLKCLLPLLSHPRGMFCRCIWALRFQLSHLENSSPSTSPPISYALLLSTLLILPKKTLNEPVWQKWELLGRRKRGRQSLQS